MRFVIIIHNDKDCFYYGGYRLTDFVLDRETALEFKTEDAAEWVAERIKANWIPKGFKVEIMYR